MSASVLKTAYELVDALKNAKDVVAAIDELTAELLPAEIAEIVKGHSLGAAASGVASGWIPGFGGLAAAAMSAGFIWTMYGRINAKIRLPFSENVIKSLASGVATNLASYMVGGFVISTVFSFVPGIGNVGASVLVGGTCYALTIASGFVYLKVLTKLFLNGTNPTTLDADALKRETKTVIETEDVKQVLREAKQNYRSK